MCQGGRRGAELTGSVSGSGGHGAGFVLDTRTELQILVLSQLHVCFVLQIQKY